MFFAAGLITFADAAPCRRRHAFSDAAAILLPDHVIRMLPRCRQYCTYALLFCCSCLLLRYRFVSVDFSSSCRLPPGTPFIARRLAPLPRSCADTDMLPLPALRLICCAPCHYAADADAAIPRYFQLAAMARDEYAITRRYDAYYAAIAATDETVVPPGFAAAALICLSRHANDDIYLGLSRAFIYPASPAPSDCCSLCSPGMFATC